MSSKGSLACHIYYETGYPFIMVISKDIWHSHLLLSAWQVELSILHVHHNMLHIYHKILNIRQDFWLSNVLHPIHKQNVIITYRKVYTILIVISRDFKQTNKGHFCVLGLNWIIGSKIWKDKHFRMKVSRHKIDPYLCVPVLQNRTFRWFYTVLFWTNFLCISNIYTRAGSLGWVYSSAAFSKASAR